MAKVVVKPIEMPKWHKKSGKDSFKQPITITALYDHSTGEYSTGLTDKEIVEYSKKLKIDLNPAFNPLEPHPFWDSQAAKVKLQNYLMTFDSDNPRDYIKIKLMKASKFVANSMKEFEQGLYPQATHVIYDENEEYEIKASKVQKKQKAVKIASDLEADTKASLVQILSNKTVRGRKIAFIDVEIDNLIENDTDTFLKYAQMSTEELYIRSSILEAIHRNVLTKEGVAIYYMGDKIAEDYEAAVAFFKDPQNQKFKLAILEKLNK